VGAMMVSYTRARAESLGFVCKVGLLTRMERIVLIGALSAVGLPTVMIWALALLSVFTVIQRILHVYAVSRREEQRN
jgi:CDP-diacylglycerol--glycerol-3-phosphate 3-phosphatidyltransferase